MDIFEQIKNKKIVCVKTGEPLVFDEKEQRLFTFDRKSQYPVMHNKAPVVLDDPEQVQEYFKSSAAMGKILQRMDAEYQGGKQSKFKSFLKNNFWTRLKSNDYRSQASKDWLERIVYSQTGDALCLSLGGGPNRISDHFTNLNIGLYPEVDIVADAHRLPYADDSVDAIYHEAVLEHLHTPHIAVGEMLRVLKRGGRILSITPFLHEYHGYPHHYCNFTLTGHVNLYKTAGFTILDSGTCVGPMNTLNSLNLRGIDLFLPKVMKVFLKGIFKFFGILLIRPLDKIFNKNPDSHILATTTFVAAEKPL